MRHSKSLKSNTQGKIACIKLPIVINNKKKKLYNSQTKILTEIDSGDFFFHKGIIIKYSILSKNTFIDYKISKSNVMHFNLQLEAI